jgi:uncharacterized protein YhaN
MDRYVQNTHGNSIKINAVIEDGGERHPWEKVFGIQKYDGLGRETSTGFTKISEQEYELCMKDKLFLYFHRLGKLTVHDGIPAGVQTPHEAVVEARKQIRALQEQLHEAQKGSGPLKEKNSRLTAELAAARKESGPLKDEITCLTTELDGMRKKNGELEAELARLNEELAAAQLDAVLDEGAGAAGASNRKNGRKKDAADEHETPAAVGF